MLRSAPASVNDRVDHHDTAPPIAAAGGRLLKPAEVEHYRRLCGLFRDELAALADIPVREIVQFEERFRFTVATNLTIKAIFLEWGAASSAIRSFLLRSGPHGLLACRDDGSAATRTSRSAEWGSFSGRCAAQP